MRDSIAGDRRAQTSHASASPPSTSTVSIPARRATDTDRGHEAANRTLLSWEFMRLAWQRYWGDSSAIVRTISLAMSEQLRPALKAAIHRLAEGSGATIAAVTSEPDLMTLGCVVVEATDGRSTPPLDFIAGVVIVFLEQAADSLEELPHAGTTPNRAAAARAALALEPGTQGRPLRGRRGQTGRLGTVARWLSYETGSLSKPRQDGRSPFDALLDDVAEHLMRREVEHRITEQRLAQQARRPPLELAMRVDWLARFERYYAMWSYVSGVRSDVELAVASLRSGEPEDPDYFTRKSLYYLACFLRDLEAFTRQRGGLWIMPHPKAENTVADAVWLLRKPTPLTELDESMLRLAVDAMPEAAVFVKFTYTDQALQRLVVNWREWIDSCDCPDVEQPEANCRVHQTIGWARTFMGILDAQWDLLADWYEVPRTGTVVDPPRLTHKRLPAPPA